MKTKLTILADLLEMEPDHVREAALAIRERKECAHDWELTWPNDPEEWKHKKCCGSVAAQIKAREEREARQARLREERSQRMIEQGRNPSLAGLAAIIAASIAMKR